MAEARLAALGPGSPEPEVDVELRRFDSDTDLGVPVKDRDAARACLPDCGSTSITSTNPTRLARNWRIPTEASGTPSCARREPDPSNSQYWWRRVGAHPVLGLLRENAPKLGYDFTTPEAFVDFCDRVRDSRSSDEGLARHVQLLEWQLLFDWCYRKAVGTAANFKD